MVAWGSRRHGCLRWWVWVGCFTPPCPACHALPNFPPPPPTSIQGCTSWEVPVAEVVVSTAKPVYALAGVATHAPDSRKKLGASRASWKRIVDYARMEATSALAAKSKKFAGLRKFAEVAAKKKADAVTRKADEASEQSAFAAAQAAKRAAPRKPILDFLNVEVPPLERQNVRRAGGRAGGRMQAAAAASLHAPSPITPPPSPPLIPRSRSTPRPTSSSTARACLAPRRPSPRS